MTEPAIVNAATAYSLLADGVAPEGMRVEGVLDYSARSGRELPRRFPSNMHVDVLDLTQQGRVDLPCGLRAYELKLSGTPIQSFPPDIAVRVLLDLSQCDRLESLPDGLTVGTLNLRGCSALRALPEMLDVWFLDMSGCWAFDQWPALARIRGGRLQLRGCMAVRRLPPYIKTLSALNVCDCPNLTSLPASLKVTGWLDLARSGLTEENSLPAGLARTQLRWAGIPIDRRIAFHPESLAVDELLQEKNAERRRALLDRFGYSRFLEEADAEILDQDSDPGGPRQLLRVALPGDEDLIALSCHCPSTQRHYIIRVPPTTTTCHQAAAWIAGFDNPDDYRPVIET